MRVSLRSTRLAVALALAALGCAAHAQEGFVYHVTGVVVLTLDGAERTFHVYAVDIPEDVAEGVEDADVREVLERAAGTSEHGATWDVPEPVVMGTIVLSNPTSMAITVAARPTEDHAAGQGEVRLGFDLDLATLALAEGVPVVVWFFPKAFSTRDFYALTDGALEVAVVERVDDVTLRIDGTVSGLLSFQERLGEITHDPNDTIAVTGRFELRQVVGTRPLTEVLPGE